ncbi:uncharacterized protein [Primulina huaijiensis]|uniref:uncharacterized protein n=1 Tax=Primulina huaijiensis TaxID=1492673 RepID=UPI003CC78004
MSHELTHRLVLIQKINHPSIQQRGIQVDALNLDINLAGDWRDYIKQVLESLGRDIPHGLKVRALYYVLVEGDLYMKGLDGLLLRCIGFPEALEMMKQVHEGVCEAHQSGVKMRWLIRRYGYYWPSILKDCIKHAKGCQPLPLKKAEQGDVINFVKENNIHRFGIPESLTTDQGTMFTGSDMREFSEDYGIKLINSSSHYPQSNGQAEASNKVLIKILQKMMEENPRDWPRLLSETLWAYRTSKRAATGVSPFALTLAMMQCCP